MKTYDLFKKIIFQLDPELAHNLSIGALSLFPQKMASFFQYGQRVKADDLKRYDLSISLGDGNRWSFPVGLAAGLDKNAQAISFFSQLPFGALEVGTVTPKAQEGNPRPRLFRLENEQSLLNRMGFNNEGMDRVFLNLVNSQTSGKILGVNLGKNKKTPAAQASQDYQKLYRKFEKSADYLVINVSSPNTPGLRDLQKIEALREIFEAINDLRKKEKKPLYLKISPDLSWDDLPGIIQLAHDYELSGIVATNTTILPERGEGGVSGKLLAQKSRSLRKRLFEIRGENSSLEVIGVGGISRFEDLLDFWKMGGKVCQIYTSFIYQGPEILFDFEYRIIELMKKNQIYSLDEFLDEERRG